MGLYRVAVRDQSESEMLIRQQLDEMTQTAETLNGQLDEQRRATERLKRRVQRDRRAEEVLAEAEKEAVGVVVVCSTLLLHFFFDSQGFVETARAAFGRGKGRFSERRRDAEAGETSHACRAGQCSGEITYTVCSSSKGGGNEL